MPYMLFANNKSIRFIPSSPRKFRTSALFSSLGEMPNVIGPLRMTLLVTSLHEIERMIPNEIAKVTESKTKRKLVTITD